MIAITMTYRSISKEAYFLKNETVGVTRVANFRKGLECACESGELPRLPPSQSWRGVHCPAPSPAAVESGRRPRGSHETRRLGGARARVLADRVLQRAACTSTLPK